MSRLNKRFNHEELQRIVDEFNNKLNDMRKIKIPHGAIKPSVLAKIEKNLIAALYEFKEIDFELKSMNK